MSTFKKLFASIAAVMIVVSTAPVAVFGQTSRSAEYQDAYAYAFDNGITTMGSIDAANLAGTTTRGQAAKMFVEFAKSLGQTADTSANTCNFNDLGPIAGTDLAAFAVEACQMGLMGINTNGIFNPNGVLSRAEYGTILSRVLFGDTYNGGNPFYAAHLNALNQAGLMNDLSNPERSIMRGDAFLLLYRASEADLDGMTPGFCSDIETVFACTIDPDGSMGLCPAACLGGGTTDPTDPTDSNWEVKVGDVNVSLSPSSVGARSIPRKGLVPFGTFQISAGSAPVQIASITVKREGLSQRSDVRRVHLERNGVRISSRSNINTDDTATISFSPVLAIPAGGMESLTLVVELNDQANGTDGATVGAQHNFAILSANAINSSANVVGSFPVRTATATVSSYTVENVELTATTVSTTQKVGDEGVSFGEIQVQTFGDKDNVVKSIMLRNDGQGNASSSLNNLGLYKDGVLVSQSVQINGRDVTFILNDTIDNGQAENYQIKADIIGAERSDDDYEFVVRSSTDVTVVEKDSGFSAPVTLNSNPFTLGEVDVDGGDLLLSRDTAFQLNQTVSASTNDVVLWAANLNVGQAATFEDVYVDFGVNDGNGLENISSLRLVVGNQTLASYSPVAGDTDFTFETTFTVSANTKIKILANFRNTANGTFTIGTVDLGDFDLRYVANDEPATVDGTVAGIVTNINAATLTAIRNDGVDNATLVPGANNVLLLGFDLRANDVSDVRVTSIQPSRAGTVNVSNVTNVRLYQGETLLSTRNDFNFGSINVTIPKNGSKRFTVVADFNTSVTAGQTIQLTVGAAQVAARNVASNAIVNLGNTATSENFQFAAGGSVLVTTNSSQANRSIISPSTTPVSVYKFNIEAKDDVLRLTDLYIEDIAGDVDLASALRTATLTIGSTTVTGVVLASDLLHFPFGSNGLVLAKDVVANADLQVAFFDSNTRTDLEFQFALPTAAVAGQVAGTTRGMRLISDSTGLEVARPAASIQSRAHLLARSAPTVARLAESTSSTAYKFTVTAGANRKITLTNIHLDVKGIDQPGATFTLRREGSNVPVEVLNASEDLIVAGTTVMFDTLAQDFEINAGSTVTYVVEISGVDTSANLDRTREVRFEQLVYEDDVNTPSPIAVSAYNVLPTTASTFKY